jgi:hypothetical protein
MSDVRHGEGATDVNEREPYAYCGEEQQKSERL